MGARTTPAISCSPASSPTGWSGSGDSQGALELTKRALAAVEGQPRLSDLELLAQLNLAVNLVNLDRVEDAETALRRTQRLADRTGNLARLGQAQVWLANLFVETGGGTTPSSRPLRPAMCCRHMSVAM